MDQNNSQNNELKPLPGERGIPSINELGRSTNRRGLTMLVVLLSVIAMAVLGYSSIQKKKHAKEAEGEAQKKESGITNTMPERKFDGSAPPAASPEAVPLVPGVNADGKGGTEVDPNAPALPGKGTDTNGVAIKTPRELDKSESPLMVSSASHSTKAQEDAKPDDKRKALYDLMQQSQQPQAKSASLGSMLNSTDTTHQYASLMKNRSFILAKGSMIDCALQTRLDSTVPGMTSCVVTRNIYSDNGKVVLIEKGSKATGEYQANVRQGQARIFILWSRIKTPHGVLINLDSPGADQLGGAGVPGYVDNHFWQRFGGALMLSLVDDAARGLSTIGTTSNSSGQTNFNLSGTSEAAQSVAAEALKNTINIQPTLTKNQGERVGIFVARDLNFSRVYNVTAK